MRILFLVEDLASGGAERVVSLLANQFSKIDDITVATLRKDEVCYSLNAKVKYVHIKQKNDLFIIRSVHRVMSTVKEIREAKPDVVIAFDTFCNIYAVFCRLFINTKIIISERNDPNNYPNNKYMRYIRNIAYRFADGIVFQTKGARNYFRLGKTVKTVIIPNPINESFLPDIECSAKEKVIVNVCRLNEQKNLKLFVDIIEQVIAKYTDYSAVIYGEGPERPSLIKYIENRGLSNKISLPGHCMNVKEELEKCMIYLCTSDYEGISNSILEAMTLGLPVVATDCPIGGTKMMIRSGKNGFLYKVGQSGEAVSIIERLIEDDKLRLAIGNNARKIRDHWSIEKISKMWYEFIDDVVDRGN